MKRFLTQTLIFVGLALGVLLGSSAVVNYRIDTGNYFEVPGATQRLVLGHSHPECAFDDTILSGTKNLAQSGESYFYTYLKLKKLLEGNDQIKTVFLELTNNQIRFDMEEWIWDDKHLSHRFHKYCAFMDWDDLMLLVVRNPRPLINGQSLALRENLKFLLKGQRNLPEEQSWGGYLPLEEVLKDKKIGKYRGSKTIPQKLAEVNLTYLGKCLELCRNNDVKAFLVRSPLHPEYLTPNEEHFLSTRRERFPEVPFLDFREFPLLTEDFADLEHVNQAGAKKFSTFVGKLIEQGLLDSESPEEDVRASLGSLQRHGGQERV